MILRLFMFLLGGAAMIVVPGAGVAYVAHKLMGPRLARRKLLKQAEMC